MNLDPMVGLMEIGDRMVVRSITAIGVVVAASGISAIAGAIPNPISQFVATLFEKVAGFAYLVVLIGLGAGLFLFYLLPLMPFIYFFFAIASWIMEVFEAIIAMPLWAVSHLKIDGDGLPGPLAINGYFLLLGILLRPTLIVFGLIGGYIVFGAAIYLLGSVFDIIVDEVRGGDDIGGLGKLIYTIIFVYLSYNMGITCFKMVDSVPRGILRWIGQGGATPFSDEKPEDPFQGSKGMIFAAAGVASLHRPGSTRGMFQDAQGKSLFEKKDGASQS
jgi:conjugal transfer/type IV secretion protein DotA/TraY